MGKGTRPERGVNWTALRKGRSAIECIHGRCDRLKQRGSDYCMEHSKQQQEKN